MDDWLTTDQAATLARYHVNHIRRLIRQGKVEAIKLGGLVWLVHRASLLAYVAEARGERRGPKRRG